MNTINNGANRGFENDLWRAADALRSKMDTAEFRDRVHREPSHDDILPIRKARQAHLGQSGRNRLWRLSGKINRT
jgi:hypothetical protein